MNGFIRGALGLALAATAGLAIAQPYGPPLAGAYPDQGQMHAARHDDMPGPDRQAGPRYDAYGFDYQGLTADGYDRHGYDAHGFDRYGFDPTGHDSDGFDRYGYDENGRDRYGRAAPAARAEVDRDTRAYAEPRDYGYDDRRGPPAGYDPQALGRQGAYGYGESSGSGESWERSYGYGRPPQDRYDDRYVYGDDRNGAYGDDRYGPVRDDRYAYDPEVPSYGGAMQHFADPRCSTCSTVRNDCGCRGLSYGGGYETGSVSLGSAFFYDNGGVGPIPDAGYYGGGGGYVVAGGGASASSSAYASSSTRVSIGVRTGGGGHHGGGKGGCNCGGGHK